MILIYLKVILHEVVYYDIIDDILYYTIIGPETRRQIIDY